MISLYRNVSVNKKEEITELENCDFCKMDESRLGVNLNQNKNSFELFHIHTKQLQDEDWWYDYQKV